MNMKRRIKRIAVLGDGGWGTTLAIHLSKKKFIVTVWGAFPRYVKTLNKKRENIKFLPGIKIPRANIAFSADLNRTVQNADLIILAIPSQYSERIIKQLKCLDLSRKILLSVIKGIENKSLMRISEIILKELGKVRLAVLSGPTIASEVAKGIPSTAVIACKDPKTAKLLQEVINSETFRIYTNSDIIGVEMGGSIKNVIAIACGVCDGLGFGTNTKAAILARGLAEMARLGIAMGAQQKTFFGLSGLGDLATTCFNPQSRNRSVGEALGRGKTISQIMGSMDMVAEGVSTAKAIFSLSKKFDVSMPITQEVYNIIYRNKLPRTAVSDLMGRKTKPE